MDVTEQCKIKTEAICAQSSNNAKNMPQLRMCFAMFKVNGKKITKMNRYMSSCRYSSPRRISNEPATFLRISAVMMRSTFEVPSRVVVFEELEDSALRAQMSEYLVKY